MGSGAFEQGVEGSARPREAGLHRALRDTELAGDLLHGEVVDVVEQEDGTLLHGQRRQCRGEVDTVVDRVLDVVVPDRAQSTQPAAGNS